MNTVQIEKEIKVRFDFNRSKQLLKEKYQAKMLFAHADGMWEAGPPLITLLQACLSENEVVILDLYENPVRVNPVELQQLATMQWQEQMNAWELEFSELRKIR
jgi:hypothetical protein